MPRDTPTPLDFLSAMPGFYIRRLQQIAVAVFLEETADFGVTPVQFAALAAVALTPGMDQRTLARTIGFDTSTIGGVVDRLETRGLLRRQASPEDRRVRLLDATAAGQALLAEIEPAVRRAQVRMLAPLPAEDQAQMMRMLRTLVEANNDLSRAPRDAE